MPCSICKKSGHNRVTCVDARRIPVASTSSEEAVLFALTEDATSPYSVEKENPIEAPRERGVFVEHKRSVPTEECDSTEKRDTQEMKRKPEERSPEEKKAPRERGVFVKHTERLHRGVGVAPTQGHGFSLEKDIMRMIYHMTEEELHSIPYTSKADIPAELNRLDHCDVSIKTSGHPNMVCMADCLRVYDSVSSEKPLHMIVIHYLQEADTKKITSIIEIDLTHSHEALFGSLTRAEIEILDRAVKAIPQKKKPTEEERNSMYAIRDSLQARSGAIHLDIKCNSTQSRLQCSFNRFQQFLESHPTRIIAKSNTHEFRGGALSPQIVSSRRVFKKTLAPQESH